VVFLTADRTLNEAWVGCDEKGLVAWVGGAGWVWGGDKKGFGGVGGEAIRRGWWHGWGGAKKGLVVWVGRGAGGSNTRCGGPFADR
jgi:hypothetical protein